MKNNYQTPQARVILLETEGLIAGSATITQQPYSSGGMDSSAPLSISVSINPE
ncbi:MAG: hypothetical protein WCQ86_06035 [Bacteroidaceae bacterium]